MTDLTGKTALVTGSVQGIGLAVATALAGAGARIAVHGLAGDAQIEEACNLLKHKGAPQAEFFGGDLRNPERIAELMAAVQSWGGADIVVNNAGIQHTAPIAKMPGETWEMILSVNLSAAFYTMQAALPGMADRGYGGWSTFRRCTGWSPANTRCLMWPQSTGWWASPGLFMTALIWALMRWLFGVFHGLGMGHRLRGLWRLRLICRVMVSGFIGRSSRGPRCLRVAGLSSRQSVQDGDEQGFVWTG